jgi:DNA-directed RNA polymerase subunit L
VLRIFNVLGTEIYNSNHVEVLNYLKVNDQLGNYIIRITTAEGKELDGKLQQLSNLKVRQLKI